MEIQEDLPAAPRTATFVCAGRVVEKHLACKRDDRMMLALMECIVSQVNAMNQEGLRLLKLMKMKIIECYLFFSTAKWWGCRRFEFGRGPDGAVKPGMGMSILGLHEVFRDLWGRYLGHLTMRFLVTSL